MTAPLPRRRAKGYDPSKQWKAKYLFLPAGLDARIKEKSAAERRTQKDIIIEALEAKLSVPDPAKPAK